MTKKTMIWFISICVFTLIPFVLFFVFVYYENKTGNNMFGNISTIITILVVCILILYVAQVRKKCKKLENKASRLIAEGKYEECELYLNYIKKKTYVFMIFYLANIFLVRTYLLQNRIQLAKDMLNKDKRIKDTIELSLVRIELALYDNNLAEARRLYQKWSTNKKAIKNANYVVNGLDLCSRAIKMCESGIFDETLYDKTKFPFVKELCRRYK